MSNWVYPKGIIKIDGITEKGLKKIYGLKNKKDIENFYSSSKNWEYYYDGENYLRLIHDKKVKDFIKQLETPFGSEGNMEAEICRYNNHISMWGHDSTSFGTADYNSKTQELNLHYVLNLSDEEYENQGWKNVWFSEEGVNFVLAIFGDLRDADMEAFKIEMDKYLKTLGTYFCIEEVRIEASECYSNKIFMWRDNEFIETRDNKFTKSIKVTKDVKQRR